MIFAKKNSYGVTNSVFLNQHYIGYANLCRVKTNQGLTIGNATSIDKNKQICVKKCFSEYLERFALGIPVDKNKKCDVLNYIDKSMKSIKFSNFGYGDSLYSHNDTTGTATGKLSDKVICKAICELVEKNEALCFWYSNCGKKIILNKKIREKIFKMNFISDEFYCFLINEITNFPTIIFWGFRNGKLLTTGISCTNDIRNSLDNAIQEAKIIEWQQYNNEKSIFFNYSEAELKNIHNIVMKKNKSLEIIDLSCNTIFEEEMKFSNWIKEVYVKLVFVDEKRGLKTIKCISKELLASIPIKENIEKSLNMEVVKRYYKDVLIDCPIV